MATTAAPSARATMATFSRKTVLFVLLALVLLSLVFRYPFLDHERNQTDSYFIHYLANNIVSNGRAEWTIHPLSYIGYYPLSYPSGTPFLLSEAGTTAEITLEAAVLMMGMIFGVLQCLASFCFLRLFVNRMEYVLFGTFLCVTSARLVDTTYWVATARGPLAVLILLTVLVLIEAGRVSNLRLMSIGALLAITCVSVHHMAVFLVLFALAQIVVSIGHAHFNRHGFGGRLSPAIFYGVIAGSIVLAVFGVWAYFGLIATQSLGSTELFDFEPRFLSVAANALAVYSSQIGLILPFAFLGIPYLLLRRQMDARAMFPLAVFIFFIPFIGFQLYASLIIAPYVVILGVNWIRSTHLLDRTKTAAYAVVALLVVSSLALPFLMVDRWNDKAYIGGDGVVMDSDVFNTASYCGENYGSQISISNAAVYKGLIRSLSDIPFSGPGISSLLTGEVTQETVESGIGPSDRVFPDSLYSWLEYEENPLLIYFETRLMMLGIGYLSSGVYSSDAEFSEYLTLRSRLVVYVDNNWPESHATGYSVVDAVFPSELRNSESTYEYTAEPGPFPFAGYLVYESGRSSVYIVQLPVLLH